MGLLNSKIKSINPLDFGHGNDQQLSIIDLKYDPDEKWSNLYREREKNHIYKWVGVSAGKNNLSLVKTISLGLQ